jgi:hypothetical protein
VRRRIRSAILPPKPKAPPAEHRPAGDPRVDRLASREEAISRQSVCGAGLRPAYAHLIDLSPPGSGRLFAQQRVREIQAVINRHNWTDTEAKELYKALAVWRRRADGRDARYLLAHGARRGRLPRALESDIRVLQTAMNIQDTLQRYHDERHHQHAPITDPPAALAI